MNSSNTSRVPRNPANLAKKSSNSKQESSHKDSDENFNVEVRAFISNSKFPIVLAYSPERKEEYAMKIFEYRDGQISCAYKNEARFGDLSHQNIISMVRAVDKQMTATEDNKSKYISYILMELAQSDFADATEAGIFS